VLASINPALKDREMSQNLIQLNLNADDYVAIDGALTVLEQRFAGLNNLSADESRGLVRMGEKSEAFCRQALMAMEENRQMVPDGVGLDDARADWQQLDELRSRAHRLQCLSGRAEDSMTAPGSDVMSTALEGYALLKMMGKGAGLAPLREALGNRFSGRRGASGAAGAGTTANAPARGSKEA
jgi:hypothetical protein